MARIGWLANVALGALLLASCAPEAPPRRALSFDTLMQGRSAEGPQLLSAFTAAGAGAAPGNRFTGRLVVDAPSRAAGFDLSVDELGLTATRAGFDEFPALAVEFLQDGRLLIPAEEGPLDTGHGWWDVVLRPGRVWDEPGDNGFSRAVVPFALKQRGEDCTHNGLLTFVFRAGGEISHVAYQVSSQTCAYLKFEMWGLAAAAYEPGDVSGAAAILAAERANRAGRIPLRSIADLSADYPGAESANFGSVDEIDPADMTAYGFVIDGTHYVGGCMTPRGPYPYCDELALPSYSTAKSLVGGFGLMLMEALYPGTARASIGELVPECDDSWDDVTIEDALDMTTGHYRSPDMHADEDAAIDSAFYRAASHAGKVDYACNTYPRQSAPGQRFTYHTWDTYLVGTALNRRLRELRGPDADFYDDLIVPLLWEPLGLSRLARATRRTDDAAAQPFTGFGLTFVRDDIARLLQFVGPADGRIDGIDVLDRTLFDAIKQRIPGDPGMVAELDSIRYNNGFRSFDVSAYLGCDAPVWVVTMSGFGGINFVVMPNDTAYYYVSDGYVHRYLDAVREAHRIRPMCAATSGSRAAGR